MPKVSSGRAGRSTANDAGLDERGPGLAAEVEGGDARGAPRAVVRWDSRGKGPGNAGRRQAAAPGPARTSAARTDPARARSIRRFYGPVTRLTARARPSPDAHI